MINLILYSSGLGYINRGFETFTRELYETLKECDSLNVTLFQGRGDKLDGANTIWAPKRTASFYNYLPFKISNSRKYFIEDLVFGIPIIASTYWKREPIIHFSEPVPARILYQLRKKLGGDFTLLFSNGGPFSPEHYKRFDYIQTLTPSQKEEALAYGISADKLFMIPYGLDSKIFSLGDKSKELRKKSDLPLNKKIILTVGAVNKYHKRMDWLVKEFSGLDQSEYFLWIVGQKEGKETEDVKLLAGDLLCKESYRFSTVSYNKMPEVYNASDLFVLCSLNEGFGRVYLEAMSAGLPVIAHRTKNTEWILNIENDGLIDMSEKGMLKKTIETFFVSTELYSFQSNINKKRVYDMFDWKSLQSQYIDMYKVVSERKLNRNRINM